MVNTMKEYKCQYCGKPCTRPGPLSLHERTCSMNPNREHFVHTQCNFHPERKAKVGGWECPTCHNIFKSKNVLYAHRHQMHPGTIKTRCTSHICPYCNLYYSGSRKMHYKICNKKPHGPHAWTKEERHMQAERKRLYAKEHPDKCNWKTSKKFLSPPCELLKTLLRQAGIRFIAEYTDNTWSHAYSLDIAIPELKVDIEVNGNQHYCGGALKPYYQTRHDYLVEQGWDVIELHFKKCYNNAVINHLISTLRSRLEHLNK